MKAPNVDLKWSLLAIQGVAQRKRQAQDRPSAVGLVAGDRQKRPNWPEVSNRRVLDDPRFVVQNENAPKTVGINRGGRQSDDRRGQEPRFRGHRTRRPAGKREFVRRSALRLERRSSRAAFPSVAVPGESV